MMETKPPPTLAWFMNVVEQIRTCKLPKCQYLQANDCRRCERDAPAIIVKSGKPWVSMCDEHGDGEIVFKDGNGKEMHIVGARVEWQEE